MDMLWGGKLDLIFHIDEGLLPSHFNSEKLYAHYGRAAHMASQGGAPNFSSGNIWATSVTNTDDDHRTDRMRTFVI